MKKSHLSTLFSLPLFSFIFSKSEDDFEVIPAAFSISAEKLLIINIYGNSKAGKLFGLIK